VPKIRLHVGPKLGRPVRRAFAVGLTIVLTGSSSTACSPGSPGGTSSAQCAAVLVYGDHSYAGRGHVRRDPATTGRIVTAMVPPCDDSGGRDQGETAQRVRVAELVDVPLETAFLWHDDVYVRHGRRLAPTTRNWFLTQRCSSVGTFQLTADWLGVTGPNRPRFDGDLRPPYRLEVHVTEGPRRYVGATILVRAGSSTDPALGPESVKTSLWKSGQVIATVSCANGGFRARALRVP
jgi:hypothetical protein